MNNCGKIVVYPFELHVVFRSKKCGKYLFDSQGFTCKQAEEKMQ